MRTRSKLGYRLVTATSLGAAAVGVVLPLVPTTPFLLLAAWSAARHSPALEARLLTDPRVGPHLRAWRGEGALSRRARLWAIGALAVSFLIAMATVPAVWLKVAVGMMLAAVALYLATRPLPGGSGAVPRLARHDG